MNLSLLNLGVELTSDMRSAQEKIIAAFGKALDDQQGVSDFIGYATEADFLEGLNTALDGSDVVVLTVDAELFLLFKAFLANAFHLKLKSNKNVQKALQLTSPDMTPDMAATLAELPADADALLSEDGYSSGFAFKTKRQIMVALPLDNARMDYLMQDSVLPYLRDHLNISAFIGGVTPTEKKPILPMFRERQAAAVPSAKAEQLNAALPMNEPFVESVVKKLRANGTQVAIADTKTIDFVKNVAAVVPMQDVILLSPAVLEKGDFSAEDYCIHLAKATYDNADADLGAVLSKVYAKENEDGTKTYCVYTCVSDGKAANEAKVVAAPDDTPPELMYKAIEVLFRLIGNWQDANAKTAVEEPNSESQAPEGPLILS